MLATRPGEQSAGRLGPTMTTDDDRAAYLEGEDSTVLDAKERRALDGVRELLADPAVWNEPGPGLEAEIVAAIGTLDAEPTRSRHHRRRLVAVAAAVVVVLAVGAIALRFF